LGGEIIIIMPPDTCGEAAAAAAVEAVEVVEGAAEEEEAGDQPPPPRSMEAGPRTTTDWAVVSLDRAFTGSGLGAALTRAALGAGAFTAAFFFAGREEDSTGLGGSAAGLEGLAAAAAKDGLEARATGLGLGLGLGLAAAGAAGAGAGAAGAGGGTAAAEETLATLPSTLGAAGRLEAFDGCSAAGLPFLARKESSRARRELMPGTEEVRVRGRRRRGWGEKGRNGFG
jgi:hypothetical protein